MNALVAASGAATASLVYWRIAVAAAERRKLAIGTLPPLLPILAAAAGWGAAVAGFPAPAVAGGAGAAVAGYVDARTGYIFNPLTNAMLAVSATLAIAGGHGPSALGGAGCAGGALFALYAVTRGRGLGLGDVKLGMALGAAMGAPGGLTAIAFAFGIGGAYGAWLLVTKRARAGNAIRFGPFMAAGTFAALFAPLAGRA